MTKINFQPDQDLNCLMIQPEFSALSFWNYKETCETIGAKTPSPPLGLLTVAALLPQNWSFKLMDLNTRAFSEEDWAWADMICVGGMLPQQEGILATVKRANADGKFVVCGGADPSSQPHLYKDADALIVGEGETAIPKWLDAWRSGKPGGVHYEDGKPDVTQSPVPRYDLLDFGNYAQIGLQYSRGCPFNCEFCDIIELYGRKPRTKTSAQVLAELDLLNELGYSGCVDIVDDNFIGNKRQVKRDLLPALIEWNKKDKRPFYFATEASMNMADDDILMAGMRDAGFRIVFMGIETPDKELLLKTQKSQNTMHSIVDRVRRVYDFGIVVTAGFIMGFDGEKKGMDESMAELIEDCYINMAMVGLLVALPNTQLSRRLAKEERLLNFRGERIKDPKDLLSFASAGDAAMKVVDQTVAGLNFITTRDRVEILKEYRSVLARIYEPRAYFDRVIKLSKILGKGDLHTPKWFEVRRSLLGFVNIGIKMTKRKETRWLYWRNVGLLLLKGPFVMEQCMRLMAIYLHFFSQSRYLLGEIERQETAQASVPSSVARLVDRPVA